MVDFFEFLGPLLGGTAVANTIGTFVDLNGVDSAAAIVIVLCGLLGAITWNLFTWWKCIPSSSSHALVGGLIGAVVVAPGLDHVVWGGRAIFSGGHVTGVTKVLLALVLSSLLGFWAAFAVHKVMSRLLAGARPIINRDLRRAQFFNAAWLALSHGANDGQKSMGILTLVLLLGGFIGTFERLAAHTNRVVAGANATRRLVSGLGQPNANTEALIDEARAYETSADKIKADLIRLLYESFTTPINRAVIALADKHRSRETIDLCEEIDRFEAKADKLRQMAVRYLFEAQGDDAAVWRAIKMQEVYTLLETVLDSCKRAAKTVEEILIENT